MKFLVLQAHLDDAFFSITETAMTWVEDGHEVDLVTVFGGYPPEGHAHAVKYLTLWQEYEAAVERGPFEHHRAFEYLDDGARGEEQLMFNPVCADLARTIAASDADAVVCSTGIHHPDHRILAEALYEVGPGAKQIWVYDELPYFVLHPEQVMMARTPDVRTYYEREGCRDHLTSKKTICRLFGSQMGDDVERCIWAPERVWRPA